MNICGIICEYNPMHSGHMEQIAKTRRILGEDTGIICIMSGNFVQRGDFAVFDKFARARCALLGGADLVIELPLPWSMSSAESFARGAVHILNSLGVATHISFGSENGDVNELIAVSKALCESGLDERIKENLKSGVSYATARQNALESILGSKAEIIKTPNNILATEYIKTLIKENSQIKPVAILRDGTSHDGIGIKASSYIREMMRNGEKLSDYLPDNIAKVYENEISCGRGPVFYDNADMAIMYKLRSMTEDEYSALPYGSEGLYMRLKNEAISNNTLRDTLDAVKTKRYTYARIRRMAMFGFLGITKTDLEILPPYAKILGMNKNGKLILSEMKKKASIPIITKPSSVRKLDDKAQKVFEMNAKATDIYKLLYENNNERIGDSEYKTTPVIL